MKPIILAAAATLLVLLLATLLFQIKSIDRRAFSLLVTYAVVLVLLAAVSAATPANLGFLPQSFPMGPNWFDLLSAATFYSAAFFGGILQLYNLADRGFSLRILIDLLERPDRDSAADLFRNYSQGRGMRWMYEKRIDGMIQSNLVTANAGALKITPRGEKVAATYRKIRQFLNVEPE